MCDIAHSADYLVSLDLFAGQRSRFRPHFDKGRRRDDGCFRLLGFLGLTIASVLAFGHSGSPKIEAVRV